MISKKLTAAGTFLIASAMAPACAPTPDQFFSPVWKLSDNVASNGTSPGALPTGAPTSSPTTTPTSAAPSPTPTPTFHDPDPTPSTSPSPNPSASPTSAPVCDPFGAGDPETEPSLQYSHGVLAHLKYMPDGAAAASSVLDFESRGADVNTDIYLRQVNVPTRPFDQGFATQDGQVLTKPDGSVLMENFNLRFRAQILLPPTYTAKQYQFALLADDGAILSVDEGSGFSSLINDDGTHSTKMACASRPVTLSPRESLPIDVNYFQGPRYHIAVVLMMREWNGSASESECGKSGNDYFFDSTTSPSTPKTPYNDLLSRGWKPVPPEYLYLPGNPPRANPCVH